MNFRPALAGIAAVLMLTACSDDNDARTPTPPETSQAPADEKPAASAPEQAPAVPTPMPTGESPFTAMVAGRWAADPAWCSAEDGAEGSAITISEELFEGYENHCAIEELGEDGPAFVAVLNCQSEGEASREKIRMEPSGDTMVLTYLDRGVDGVTLNRCP